MACRINFSRKWVTRILLEDAFSEYPSWFVTLTYDEDHVPEAYNGVQTLRKSKILTWLNNQNRTYPFRYFVVGEYGDVSMRPHYHLVVFPRTNRPITELTDGWKKGFTSAYPLNEKRAKYIAQYATKKLTKADDQRLATGQEPEFRSSSRIPPLGSSCIQALVHQYSRGVGKRLVEERGDIERFIRIGGKIYPLPEYLLSKVRAQLGIPLLHRERLCHPEYEKWHHVQEVERDHAMLEVQENKIRKTKEANRNRYYAQTI